MSKSNANGRRCKCGSTTHFRTSNLKCPLNKRQTSHAPADNEHPPAPAATADNKQPPAPAATADNKQSPAPAATADNKQPPAPAATADNKIQPTTTTTQPVVHHDIGDNVLAMWSKSKWFLAQFTKCHQGFPRTRYDLYFPDDGKVRLGVDANRVKPCPVNCRGLPVYRRGQMIGKVFYDDGLDGEKRIPAGLWLVRRIQDNEYVCVRSPNCRNKDVTPNMTNFDIVRTCH